MAVVNEIHRELTEALADLRNSSEREATRTADRLLNHDKFNREFIGVSSSGEEAIYFDRQLGSIRGIPFDQDDFDGLGSRKIRRIQSETEADEFVRQNDDWGWLHPRYRWVTAKEKV